MLPGSLGLVGFFLGGEGGRRWVEAGGEGGGKMNLVKRNFTSFSSKLSHIYVFQILGKRQVTDPFTDAARRFGALGGGRRGNGRIRIQTNIMRGLLSLF